MPTAVKAPPGASSDAARQLSSGTNCAAEASVLRAVAEFNKTRMKAAIQADGEHAACRVGGVGNAVRAFEIECQRLFDKDVLACRDGLQRLRFMQAVRSGEHHGVNVGTAGDLLVAVDKRELMLAAEIFRGSARTR